MATGEGSMRAGSFKGNRSWQLPPTPTTNPQLHLYTKRGITMNSLSSVHLSSGRCVQTIRLLDDLGIYHTWEMVEFCDDSAQDSLTNVIQNGCWTKNKGTVPPNPWNFNRVFPYFHHPFWGIPIFGNTQMDPKGDFVLQGESFRETELDSEWWPLETCRFARPFLQRLSQEHLVAGGL